LLDGTAEVGARRAAEVVALLSEEPPREYGDDLAAAWRTARRGGDGYAARWRQEVRRLTSATNGERPEPRPQRDSGPAYGSGSGPQVGSGSDDVVAGIVTALAFPERVARARGAGAFLMVSGTGAELGQGSGLRSAEWLAVAVADRPAHSASARVRLAAVIDEDTART
ncbi:ATP-dependent helicase HrpB, partial [Streptomyces sp. SID4917]|nr:ATP-dependent helicase HrpB [Streptomyces sp. SID4917]